MSLLIAKSKTLAVGNYIQRIKYLIYEETNTIAIQDITCTCRYSTIRPDAWMNGEKVCKHIAEVLKSDRLQET